MSSRILNGHRSITLTIEWLHNPLALAALFNDSEIIGRRIGEVVFVFGCDVNEFVPVAHGLCCAG